MKFFRIYQYLGPICLTPLGYWLWLSHFHNIHKLAIAAMLPPILFAYIIPAIGANLLGLWEFNTRWRLGNFRPHHGFVFGSATSILAFLCVSSNPLHAVQGAWLPGSLHAGFLMGSVLGFWNWLYDIYAIKAGFIFVYNQQYGENKGAEAIATDYAPTIFGLFGFCYGSGLYVIEYFLLHKGRWDLYWLLLGAFILVVLSVPGPVFVLTSYLKHGHSGLKSYKKLKT